ncbi:hypothetical protein D3C84_689120 [compost metagenome]
MSTGQAKPAGAQRRVVTFGEPQDHLVDTGVTPGGDDLVGVLLAEAGNVVGHTAVEQLDVLRQVSKVRAQGVVGPLTDLGVVQAHRPAHGRPYPDQRFGQR